MQHVALGFPRWRGRELRSTFGPDGWARAPKEVAPRGGRGTIERKAGKWWKRVARARTNGSRVFTSRVRAGKGTSLRAVIGGEESLPFTVK